MVEFQYGYFGKALSIGSNLVVCRAGIYRKDFLHMAENQSQTQNGMSQVERLLAEKKQQEEKGSMKPFNATVIDVGIPARKHFPSLKDANGKTITDEKGFAKKSEKSDGYAVTLAVFGQRQFVQMVFPKPVSLTPTKAYTASGFGFDLGTNFYIKSEPRLHNY